MATCASASQSHGPGHTRPVGDTGEHFEQAVASELNLIS